MPHRAIVTEAAPSGRGAYSQAIVAGDLIFCSGTVGLDAATGQWPDGIAAQTEQALQNLDHVLRAAGASLADVVKTTVFLIHMSDFQAMNAVYASYFQAPGRPAPARSTIAVAELPRKALVEIECVALVDM